MLVHGLNQSPSSWDDLTACLNGMGLHVYRLALQGHRGLGMDDMHAVTAAAWMGEFDDSCKVVAETFSELPCYFVGFSLGCLLAMTVQLKKGRRLFDRQVLLAPALAVRPYTRLVLQLCRFLPSLPSRSPGNYVANREGTTAEAYRALFDLEREFRTFEDLSLLNVPTTVLMRPDDELVSYRLTERLVRERKLEKWRLVRLEESGPLLKRLTSFKHLIVDRQSSGDVLWRQMTREIAKFLSDVSVGKLA